MRHAKSPRFAGKTSRLPSHARGGSGGFTLLELLLVTAILSATALAAFGLMTEDRAQARMDDTRLRLSLLRRATLGVESPAYDGFFRLSGYVADNGVLPESLVDLLLKPDGYATQEALAPRLANNLDSDCFPLSPTAGEEMGEGAALLKGHRGHYLGGAAQNGTFRDGWGNIGADDDAKNFGWSVDTDNLPDELVIKSRGADNEDGESSGLAVEADISMKIRPEEWLARLDGWTITLRNASDEPIEASSFGVGSLDKLGAALLVFENTAEGGHWRQLKSSFISCDNEASTQLEAGESCRLSFGATAKCASSTIPARAPLGRHPLVLTADDKLPLPARRRLVFVDVYPGVLQPNLTWEFR
jgi:prepilin-type N-terminal cleavage/methylation domain-containing protein